MMGGQPLSRDILLTAVMPHMHWLGKDFRFDGRPARRGRPGSP